MSSMRAIVIEKPGGPEVLQLREVALPEPGPGQVRVRVHATAVNRADIMQRLGAYPAPPDAPQDIPGLELAGEVAALGPGVFDRKVGDRVFGITGGGGYAEAVVVHSRTLARIPDNLDFAHAAAVPEAFLTAYDAMVEQCGLSAGDNVVVHAVGSGVGTAAVQVAKAIGARSIGTARTESKLARARELGMTEGFVPAAKDKAPLFADKVKELTDGAGADVVLDLVGGAYTPESLACLREKGRAILVGLLAGTRVEMDLALVLRKRLRLLGTMLRARPLEEKILAALLLERRLAPLFASGALKPVIDKVMPLAEAAAAHAYMQSNDGFGKVVLTC